MYLKHSFHLCTGIYSSQSVCEVKHVFIVFFLNCVWRDSEKPISTLIFMWSQAHIHVGGWMGVCVCIKTGVNPSMHFLFELFIRCPVHINSLFWLINNINVLHSFVIFYVYKTTMHVFFFWSNTCIHVHTYSSTFMNFEWLWIIHWS